MKAGLYLDGTTYLGALTGSTSYDLAFDPGRHVLGVSVSGLRGKEYEAVDFLHFTLTTPDASPSPTPVPPRATPTPEPTFDCNTTPPPSGIKQMEWILHCQVGSFSTPVLP